MPWPSPRPGPSMVVRQWSQSVHRSPYPCYGCLVESSMLGPIRMLSLGFLIRINLIVLTHCVAIFSVEYFGQSGQSGCPDQTRTTPREVGVRCTVPPIILFAVAAAGVWCVDSSTTTILPLKGRNWTNQVVIHLHLRPASHGEGDEWVLYKLHA
ncbi:hypothetical protein BKA56DRAFT_277987 [Ilyonectria sp. MPI-CAGE-AT-0026]|nr:hypothetical protein BKA56DRAFT_277987 [Ilyonectria sp. MPI-CAGE-AT-0026]